MSSNRSLFRTAGRTAGKLLVVLLVAALAVPALTVSAMDGKLELQERTELDRDSSEVQREISGRDFSRLIQDFWERFFRLIPGPPIEPPQEPPVRPEYVPTIDPSGYAPGQH